MLTLILSSVCTKCCFSFKKGSNGQKQSLSYSQHPTKNFLAKFPIAPTGEEDLLLDAISKSMNFTFAQKEDFCGKLTNINITFVC